MAFFIEKSSTMIFSYCIVRKGNPLGFLYTTSSTLMTSRTIRPDFIIFLYEMSIVYDWKDHRWWFFHTKISSLLVSIYEEIIVDDFSLQKEHHWYLFYTKSSTLINFLHKMDDSWWFFSGKGQWLIYFIGKIHRLWFFYMKGWSLLIIKITFIHI